MDETSERVERLERSVRRLQGAGLVLVLSLGGVAALAGAALLRAASSELVGLTVQELTLQKLTIVDADWKERFRMGTFPGDAWGFKMLDHDGKMRFRMGTLSNGEASFLAKDRDGNARLMMSTLPDGVARFQANDLDGAPVWTQGSE